MKEPQKGMLHIEITDSEQIVEIECHVSKKLFELSAEDLVSAICLFQETRKELEDGN